VTPPTTTRQPNTQLPRAGDWRSAYKRSRRAAIAQCERCGVKGTAAVAAGRMTSTNLPTTAVRGVGLIHTGCGGRFIGFDITEEDDNG
jgi:hypothetical protein